MGISFLFTLMQLISFNSVANHSQLEASLICSSIDNRPVKFMKIESSNYNHGIASADYGWDGPRTFYNITFMKALHPLSREIILAHECAHHKLGHTLWGFYASREIEVATNISVIPSQAEMDAECLSAIELRANHPYLTLTKATALHKAIYILRNNFSNFAQKEQTKKLKRFQSCFSGKEGLPRFLFELLEYQEN